MEIHQFKDPATLSQAAAEWIVSLMEERLSKNDRFTWVLSGGNTPRMLYSLMASPPLNNRIPWSKLHLFWGDERDVPFEDPRNNGKMAFDSLLSRVPVPPGQIHYIRTNIPAEQSAIEYDRILHEYFKEGGESFDLVLLGMGPDGHTLSLFPGEKVIHEEQAWTKSYWLPSQNMNRITLTAPLVNRSARIAFLVTGADKAKSLQQVLHGPYDPDRFPSQIIKPVNGELHWFVDEEAMG